MRSRRLIAFICAAAVLATALPAHAWVIFGRLKPCEVRLSGAWPESKALEAMLRQHGSIGGRFIDSVTGRHFSATYLFRGREVSAQRIINDLNRLRLVGTTVEIVEGEAFESVDVNKPEFVFYDWKLTIDGTTFIADNLDNVALLERKLSPNVTMTIYLGDRLDRRKLRIPAWMEPDPLNLSEASSLPQESGPVSAFEAFARAARHD